MDGECKAGNIAMTCKACQYRPKERDGFCKKCLKIRDEIRREKQMVQETVGAKEDCRDCRHYSGKRANLPDAFLCRLNNKVYCDTKACFMFKAKGNDRRKEGVK